jgi:methanogenic corrinoid protein MtbC1
MSTISQSPAYNLKVVLKETGLKADVLRAWERRYELPKPQRTPGGHRLYSEYDIETVKWLQARQAEGLSISRAVDMWKEIIEVGRDPLGEDSPTIVSHPSGSLPGLETRIVSLRQKWVEANLVFDSISVDEVLNQAFAIYPVETVCTEILQRGLSEIGNEWYQATASVQQEHFASTLASRRLETLIAAMPRPTRLQTVLVGCPPGERHTFSTQLLSLFLSRSGFKVIYLGADIPLEQMVETAAATRAEMIVLAAQQLTTAATLQTVALALQKQGLPLAYGGLIFNRVPRLRERIPAYFLGESLADALLQIERLVAAPVAFSTIINTNETLRALSGVYREKRPQIEMALFSALQKDGFRIDHLEEANTHFGNGLFAALELGDPTFLESDLEWVKRMLIGRQIPADRIFTYLSFYNHSLQKELGDVSAPITGWIDSYLAQNGSPN